jgi:hypothetical protein
VTRYPSYSIGAGRNRTLNPGRFDAPNGCPGFLKVCGMDQSTHWESFYGYWFFENWNMTTAELSLANAADRTHGSIIAKLVEHGQRKTVARGLAVTDVIWICLICKNLERLRTAFSLGH